MISLIAQKREKKENLNQLRAASFMPAVVYSSNIKENILIKIKRQDFEKVYKQAGQHGLIDLEIKDEKPLKVIIKDIAKHPVKGLFAHADFYVVNMEEKIISQLPINIIGEAPAVNILAGILVKQSDYIEVECLPGDLLNKIDVDISGLKEFVDAIHARDLKLPETVKLISDPDLVIVNISEPKKEEEQPKVETTTTAAPEDSSKKEENKK